MCMYIVGEGSKMCVWAFMCTFVPMFVFRSCSLSLLVFCCYLEAKLGDSIKKSVLASLELRFLMLAPLPGFSVCLFVCLTQVLEIKSRPT